MLAFLSEYSNNFEVHAGIDDKTKCEWTEPSTNLRLMSQTTNKLAPVAIWNDQKYENIQQNEEEASTVLFDVLCTCIRLCWYYNQNKPFNPLFVRISVVLVFIWSLSLLSLFLLFVSFSLQSLFVSLQSMHKINQFHIADTSFTFILSLFSMLYNFGIKFPFKNFPSSSSARIRNQKCFTPECRRQFVRSCEWRFVWHPANGRRIKRYSRISLDKLIYDNYGMCKFVDGFVCACFMSAIRIASARPLQTRARSVR